MPRRDRTFTHQDVIRVFERNLDSKEQLQVLVYFFLYLLGFDGIREVLKKAYKGADEFDLSDAARILLDLIDLVILKRRIYFGIKNLFDLIDDIIAFSKNPKVHRRIRNRSKKIINSDELIA